MSLIKNYGDDSRSEVILDAANNIYVAASTRSDKDFPITPGVFQPNYGGGDQDGVMVKLSPDCKNLIFASYLGGSREDACFVLKINPVNGDIYVAGATASTQIFREIKQVSFSRLMPAASATDIFPSSAMTDQHAAENNFSGNHRI